MEEMQDTLDTVPQNDILLLLDDFNVIVCDYDANNGLWCSGLAWVKEILLERSYFRFVNLIISNLNSS